jgi:hypothetical protein
LKKLPELRGFYLAGGSAVAFHLRHRRSNDLDLFSASSSVDLVALADKMARLPDLAVVSTPKGPEGFRVAALLDLAVMKLAAIASRGVYRDFWDLHEILTHSSVTLDRALDGYVKRFGVKKADVYHVLEALTYFDDAERGPRPRGLGRKQWSGIKAYFLSHAPRALRKRL